MYKPGNTGYMNQLALLFHSEVRADVLKLLFGSRNERRYRAEIIALMDFAPASVEEELQKLVDLELLVTSKDGNRRYYTANSAHPLFPELQAIVLKVTGARKARRPATPAAHIPPRIRKATTEPSHPISKVVDETEPSPETEMYLR